MIDEPTRRLDEGALRALVPRVLAGLVRRGEDFDAAEDALQEALLDAWRRIGSFRADAAFSTWMYRIVTNRCLNMLRARRRTEPLPDDREAPASRPDRIAEARWQVEDLKLAILRLTPEQRAPLVLRELQGCSYEEIAESLDLSISAVKSRLHRARVEVLQAMRAWT